MEPQEIEKDRAKITPMPYACPDCGRPHVPTYTVEKWPKVKEDAWYCVYCDNWKERRVAFGKTAWNITTKRRSMSARRSK